MVIHKNNLIDPNDMLTKAIYSIIILFFTSVGMYASYLYTSINKLQDTITEMKIILNKTVYTMEQNVKLINSVIDDDIRNIKKDITRMDKKLMFIK